MRNLQTLAIIAAVASAGCTRTAPPAVDPPIVEPEKPVEQASQRKHWLEKLDDPALRARAVDRLQAMFEEVVSRAEKGLEAPEVKAFINETLEPLVKLYVEKYAQLDERTRIATIKLLADCRDPRTEPALRKAFEAFAEAPKTERDESDIKWASQAQAELRLENLSMPLLAAFSKLRASSMLGGISFRDVNEAVMNQPPDRAWVGPLIAKLDIEIVPVNAKDKKSFDELRDQVFWQATAAEALGRIGDPAAVEPLFKVVLDPAKADIGYTAGLALVRLGEPTTAVGIKLLRSEHEKLQAYHVKRVKELTGIEPKGKPWVDIAARVLGATGRREACAPLIAALESEKDGDLVAVLADELTRIPGAPECKEAFKKAYRRAPLKSLPRLAESPGRFRDSALVPWILAAAGSLQGAKADREAAQAALLETALKLAAPSQLGEVKAAVERLGGARAKSLMAKIEPLVAQCRENGLCYLEALRKPENQSETSQFVGIKAGYMVAIFGNEKLRDELVESLRQLPNPVLRHVAADSIDRLTPQGSRTVAETLRKMIEENSKSPDKDKRYGDSSVKQVMYRLAARAS
jgi:HEAT repeat protein